MCRFSRYFVFDKCINIQYIQGMTAQHSTRLSALLQGNQLWHAREMLGVSAASVRSVSTGFQSLDEALPHAGWPLGQLNELICATAVSSEWALMLPGILKKLADSASASVSQTVLINAPHEPYVPAWRAAGLSPDHILRVETQAYPQAQQHACWAAEQALHCEDVCAVVVWLPRAPAESLRRLQLAASQSRILLFVVRPLAALDQSSPAPLRLQLNRMDALRSQVHILKCRGSAGQVCVLLEMLSPSLRALLQARKRRFAHAPSISTTSQPSPVSRMSPRSQVIELLPDHLLIGNERAAEGSPMSVKARHGLDCTTPFSTTTLQERSLKRAARYSRNR
jgi:protein ImuA